MEEKKGIAISTFSESTFGGKQCTCLVEQMCLAGLKVAVVMLQRHAALV
jgi:hypothetical protein